MSLREQFTAFEQSEFEVAYRGKTFKFLLKPITYDNAIAAGEGLKGKSEAEVTFELAINSILDPKTKKPVFRSGDFSKIPFGVTQQLITKINEISGFGSVEDARKNLNGARRSGKRSSSRSTPKGRS